jgi:hypothetical protein
MLNVLPFVAGLIAGAAAVTALRGERARSMMSETGERLRAVYGEAQSGVRAAARAGFDFLRAPASAPEPAPAPEADVEAPAEPPPAAPKPKRRAAKRTATGAQTSDTRPAATRRRRKVESEPSGG